MRNLKILSLILWGVFFTACQREAPPEAECGDDPAAAQLDLSAQSNASADPLLGAAGLQAKGGCTLD